MNGSGIATTAPMAAPIAALFFTGSSSIASLLLTCVIYVAHFPVQWRSRELKWRSSVTETNGSAERQQRPSGPQTQAAVHGLARPGLAVRRDVLSVGSAGPHSLD